MTQKQKAIELVSAMKFKCIECDFEDNAKQCALIAVDEIIKENLELPDEPEMIVRYLYWQEVKQEINKL